jgi:ribosome biogenesis protein SSF1/2
MNGPTLHFKVGQYSLIRQVKQSQKKPFESAATLQTPPIVVLNNFGQSEENTVKLMRTTLQNMFPSINVKTVRLAACRRVVLFHMKKDDGTVEMRHYAIRATPVGISRNIKKIIQAKIPDLSELQVLSS